MNNVVYVVIHEYDVYYEGTYTVIHAAFSDPVEAIGWAEEEFDIPAKSTWFWDDDDEAFVCSIHVGATSASSCSVKEMIVHV
jgi:hypothetical protein